MEKPRLRGIVRLSDCLYRLLLRVYPAPFRADYGAEMAQVFKDCCRERYARTGARGVLLLWLAALWDLLVNALQERLTAPHGGKEGSMMPLDQRAGRLVWLHWTCAGAAGWGIAYFVSNLVNGLILPVAGPRAVTLQETGVVLMAAQGLVLAWAQRRAARRYVRHADLWAWTTVGAAGLIVAVMLVVLRGPIHIQEWSYSWILLSIGAILGLAQWLALRIDVARAGWWVAASAVGWPLAVLVQLLPPGYVLRTHGSFAAHTWWFTPLTVLAATLAGGVYGALLGRLLVGLLRRTARSEAAA